MIFHILSKEAIWIIASYTGDKEANNCINLLVCRFCQNMTDLKRFIRWVLFIFFIF